MSLADIFYLLGIGYIVISIVVMIGLLVGLWIAYHKVKQYQQKLESKLKHDFNLKNLSRAGFKNAGPLVASGIFTWGLNALKNKVFNR